ncbi:Embryonic flower 1 [Melia azedarach]|uniref:Embryonic flower 1 n=1 Tax=Melia azedarach TaxID=155640 RepID=A0ACC1XBG9_MELAZ|nr:Embryonic flower 1 [Melia azedarach]
MGAEGNTYNCGNGPNYCSSTRYKSSGTRSHGSSLGDAAIQQSDLEQVPNHNIVDGRKVDATVVADLNVKDCCPSPHNDKNGKKSFTKTPFIGHESGPEDEMNLEIPVSAGTATGVTSELITGRHHTIDIVARKTNCDGSVEFGEPDYGIDDAAEVELTNEKLKCMFKNSAEIFQTGKQPSAEEHSKIMITCGTSRAVNVVNEMLDAAKNLTTEHPSDELDMCDNASSESDETLSGNDLHDHHHDNSSGSHRRKTRKVRLLTELLAENGDAKANLTRTEDSPSNSIPNSSAGIDGLSALQGNIASVLDQSKKRKFPHDEEQDPLEITPNNFYKINQTCNESAETHGTLANLDTEEDAGVDLQIGIKSSLNQFINGSPIGKKKNKSLVLDEFLSLAPSREIIPEDIQNRTADINKVSAPDVLFRSAQTAVTSRGMYPFPLPPQKTERNSSIYKNKSKMLQFDDGQASLFPWSNGMHREDSITRKDVEIKEMHSVISPFQPSQDATTGKGLDLSLSSCLPVQGYDGKYISLLEHRQLPWQGGSSKENVVMGKDIQRNYVGDSGYPSKCETDAFFRNGVHCDLGRENYGMSLLNEKQKSTSQLETGSHARMRPVGFCNRGNNGKSIEMQEHPALTLKTSDQQADKVSEQGVPDDIPMEIVELMAKNQYERCLPDGEHERPLETTVNTSNAPMHAKGKLSFLSDGIACKPKPRAKKGRNGKITRAENGGTSKQKSVDCFSHICKKHFNFSALEQPYAPAGLVSFPQSQGKLPNGIKFSDTSSSKHSSSQNCQWIGNILGHRTSQTNLQTFGACNSCQSVPQQSKEAAHLWPSMMPSRMPFIYNTPQKHPSQSTNTDMLPHCPSLRKGNVNGNHNLNFLNVDLTNIEKHNRTFDSEPVSRPHAEYAFACKHSAMGSLDLYSNETIPAMHLLSLMDAGLPSGAPIDIDGNRKFLKRPFRHDNHSKDLSSLPSGGYKTTNAMKPSPYDYYGKNHLSENSRECFPAIQTVGASGLSFLPDKVVKKTAGFTGQASLKSQERAKAKASNSPSQHKDNRSQQSLFLSGSSGTNQGFPKPQERDKTKAPDSSSQIKDNRSQQPVFVSGGSGTNHGSIHGHKIQKMFHGSSDSMGFPLQFSVTENAIKHKSDTRNITSTVLPSKSNSKTEICSVNRNPADFSMPEAGNVYMIRGEDLKFRKPVLSENRSRSIKLDGRKRQKKLTSMKGKV